MSLGVKGDLKQEIFNEVNENVRALERLFPSAVKDGQVDFEALKEELGQFEEVGPEKYGLTWSGKQNAKKLAQQDIIGKTLKYIPEDSKNPETTENLYIEGDNLQVLKLLRQNYYGAIKMIYIDPPYNTGNDFVYKDKFNMDKVESDKAEGEVSELGERYTVNSKSSNRYHANWLNMMYPRLKVAKDLLKDDGIIFISIDDNELDNLKKICDEIFGQSNLSGIIHRRKNRKPHNAGNTMSLSYEFILCYYKNSKFKLAQEFSEMIKDEKGSFAIYPVIKADKKERIYVFKKGIVCKKNDLQKGVVSSGRNRSLDIEILDSPIIKNGILQNNIRVKGRFCLTDENGRLSKAMEEGNIFININGFPKEKRYRNEDDYKIDNHHWDIEKGKNEDGDEEIKKLFEISGENYLFSYPKPVALIKKAISTIVDREMIVLDFFSGSATTAQSVMEINAQDNGKRKFILVQFPEEVDNDSKAFVSGFKTICNIGEKRIRIAGEKIKEENKDKEGIEDLDIGFKVFRVGDTNIRWNYEKENLKTLSNEVTIRSSEEQTTFDFIAATNHQVNLDGAVSPKDRLDFMPGAKDIDIVYEILLRQRDIPLSAKVELLEDIGKRTYIFADSYLVCLEEDITAELIEKLSELSPLPIKFILRDSAFGDDIALKDEAYRRLKALIERNSGESKKTYTVEFI